MKSGKLNFLEPSGPLQACNGTALRFTFTVEPDMPQMRVSRMRIACWIPKATNTHSDYVIPLFTSTMVKRTHFSVKFVSIACLVCFMTTEILLKRYLNCYFQVFNLNFIQAFIPTTGSES